MAEKNKSGGRISACVLILTVLFFFAGCSQTTYNPTTKEISVFRLFDDNEVNGLEIVFPDGSYVVIDKTSSKTTSEAVALLKTLAGLGLLKTP